MFFRVKWLQPAMKGTSCVRRVRLRSVCHFFCRAVTRASSCFGCACACVVIGLQIAVEWLHYMIVVTFCCHVCRHMPRDAAKRIVMAAGMLHGLCFGEEAGARNRAFFRVKWLQAAMKGTSCVQQARLRSICLFFAALKRWLQAALGVLARA